MQIGSVRLDSPFVVAPMAGMTDTAFRRLVKRHGGCGLVVSEMVSSEGLVRGIDRTLEYAEFTEEERPVAIQIFGGDPEKMAAAAQVVAGMGADIVDVNMGCPVPKIAKHQAGCSLMREPEQAAKIVAAMVKAVRIPVTVKMRAGWNDASRNAPELARRVQDAGAAAVTIHGRTAEQAYKGSADWDLVARVAKQLEIPVFGSGDCVEPEQVVEKLREGQIAGVLVGRGVLRNPWILAQAADIVAGRPPREVTLEDRGRFLLAYVELLLTERVGEAEGFRHVAPGVSQSWPEASKPSPDPARPFDSPAEFHAARSRGVGLEGGTLWPGAPRREARGRERWVINKVRALSSWYSKGFECGSHFRVAVNSAESIEELREIIERFFFVRVPLVAACDTARDALIA